MGAYDSSRFSKMFSERTEANYKYISKIVNKDEEEKRIQKEFIEKYEKVLKDIENIKNELRDEANQIANVQKKGKNELKRKLYAIASTLERSGESMSTELRELVSTDHIEGHKLYEVTQLLNSLMGIAVLPYEMHKDFFQAVDDEQLSEENQGMNLAEIQDSVKSAYVYSALKNYIMGLYREGKWKSSFTRDRKNNQINEEKIVFGFLRHMRNVTCHSGNNAISILPLTEGAVIKNVMFYDNLDGQEFAMNLSIDELEELIIKIAEFYRNSRIAYINKAKTIEAAEVRVKEILGMK